MPEIDLLTLNQPGLSVLNNLRREKRAKDKSRASKPSFLNLLREEKSAGAGSADAAAEAPDAGADNDISLLLDDLHSTGDALKKRPFPGEIAAYKTAAGRFIKFVVLHGFEVKTSEGIKNKYKAGFKNRNSVQGDNKNRYSNIAVIDEKLEALAASILAGQTGQLRFLERIDEINGLLVNLLQ